MGCEPEDFEFESVLSTELILACSLRSLRCGIGRRSRPIVVPADAP